MNPPHVNKWLITASVMIPTLIEILDTSVANVALNHIQGSLSAGQEEVTWVLTSYLVANAVVIPMSGWFARLMGRKRYLLASVTVFTLSSLLCGTATRLGQLVVYRIIQGVGGGGLQPISQAILLETFPPRQRGQAMAIYGMGIVLGPILGPLVGGYFTENFSWHWIFYINLPIGILALFMNYSFVFDPPYQQRMKKGEKVDYLGLALLCLGLGSLQILLDKGQMEDWFSSDFIFVLSVVSALSLTIFVFWELGQENPILDLRIFKDQSFATGNAVMFMGFFAFFGSIVLLPMYLQQLLGYSAFDAGLVLGPAGRHYAPRPSHGRQGH
jgi:DHA2 family multidrug resistance protein